MGRLERLKVKAVKAFEKGNEAKFNRIDRKRANMQLPGLNAALKEAAPMMGGSPLAKYGCSKK